MATQTVTDLPAAGTADNADVIPVIQGGVGKKATVEQIRGGTSLDALGAAPAPNDNDLIPTLAAAGTVMTKRTLSSLRTGLNEGTTGLRAYAPDTTTRTTSATADATWMGQINRMNGTNLTVTFPADPTALGASGKTRIAVFFNAGATDVVFANTTNPDSHTKLGAGRWAQVAVMHTGSAYVSLLTGDTKA